MVQLKGNGYREIIEDEAISIPYGSIKSS